MSRTEVTKNPVLKKARIIHQSDTRKCGSNSAKKEISKDVQNESEKNKDSTQFEASFRKHCPDEGLSESQNSKYEVDKVNTEIPNSENSLERSADIVTAQAVDSNSASHSDYSSANQSIASKLEILSDFSAIKMLCNDELENSAKLMNRSDEDYKSYFDAMYAEVLKETEDNVPHDDIKIFFSSGYVDNSVDGIMQSSFSERTTKEFFAQFGPQGLVIIPDPKLFWETEEDYAEEVMDEDNAGPN